MSNCRESMQSTVSSKQHLLAMPTSTGLYTFGTMQNEEPRSGKRKRQDCDDRSQARIDRYFAFSGPAKMSSANKAIHSGQTDVSASFPLQCDTASHIKNDSFPQSLHHDPLYQTVQHSPQHEAGRDDEGICNSKAPSGAENNAASAGCSSSTPDDAKAARSSQLGVNAGRKSKLAASKLNQAMRPTHHTQMPATSGAQEDVPDHLAVFLSALTERQQFRE